MIIACHQPNYLPHLGFFNKMKQSDVFVLYDDVQFSDGFFQHRNKIRTNNGWMWLTIPVERKLAPIHTIKIKNSVLLSKKPWREYHWYIIRNEYHKTPYFKKYSDGFEKIYFGNEYMYLADFTIDIIKLIAKIAGIETKLVRHKDLHIRNGSASERLALVTEALGGTVYLSGPSGGSKYELNKEDFTKRGIVLRFQEFTHPEYEQYHSRFDGNFLKNMPAIDALFNTGKIPV